MSGLRPTIARLADGETLTEAEAEAAFGVIMAGDATPAQIAALLMAMRLRGETVPEITGAARAMRARMHAIEAPTGTVDVVGTGGDGAHTYNISTATAFVVAGCGVPVAKHGNRAVSSRSGTADAMNALGITLDIPVEQLATVLRQAGIVFLMAPRHHAALRHAAGPRSELGIRTIFNLLGPLANPARVARQLTGVFAPRWLVPVAETLRQLGTEASWVVHGQGLDELTLTGASQVAALQNGTVREFVVTPEDAGLTRCQPEALRGGNPQENAAALEAVLQGARNAYRDVVLLNAAATLIVADRAADLKEGAALAARAIDSGAALNTLNALRQATTQAAALPPTAPSASTTDHTSTGAASAAA